MRFRFVLFSTEITKTGSHTYGMCVCVWVLVSVLVCIQRIRICIFLQYVTDLCTCVSGNMCCEVYVCFVGSHIYYSIAIRKGFDGACLLLHSHFLSRLSHATTLLFYIYLTHAIYTCTVHVKANATTTTRTHPFIPLISTLSLLSLLFILLGSELVCVPDYECVCVFVRFCLCVNDRIHTCRCLFRLCVLCVWKQRNKSRLIRIRIKIHGRLVHSRCFSLLCFDNKTHTHTRNQRISSKRAMEYHRHALFSGVCLVGRAYLWSHCFLDCCCVL